MKVRVQKWGNSLAVRIPKPLAEETAIRSGSTIDISRVEDALVIRPVADTEYRLEELVAGITAENRHEEAPTGEPAGKEAW